jgi:uncharacterized membrane protein YhiD involved in acid resistance
MPEWLLDQTNSAGELTASAVAARLLLSLALGFVVAAIYCTTQRRNRQELIIFVTTLVLLTILVAMTTLVIGNSVARAFGLVGALSIVRFRTVVEDTRDTAFVIFAVVVGMAVGAGHLPVPLIGIPIVAATMGVMKLFERPGAMGSLGMAERKVEIRVGNACDPETMFTSLFQQHLSSVRLISAVTARQGVALDLTYMVRLSDPGRPLAFVKALNQLEGVQQVELREPREP